MNDDKDIVIRFPHDVQEALTPQKFHTWQTGGAPSQRHMKRRATRIRAQEGTPKGTKNHTPKRKRGKK